jgi:hypothetical protein
VTSQRNKDRDTRDNPAEDAAAKAAAEANLRERYRLDQWRQAFCRQVQLDKLMGLGEPFDKEKLDKYAREEYCRQQSLNFKDVKEPTEEQLAAMPAEPLDADGAHMAIDPVSKKGDKSKLKLPTPSKFTGKLTGDITCAKTWFQLVRKYVQREGTSLVDEFMFFVAGKAQEWTASLLREHERNGKKLTEADLEREFIKAYADGYRSDAHEARAKFHDGHVAMKVGEKLAEYNTRFLENRREAEDMGERDAIWWYKAGLVSTLRKACETQPEGGEWETLDALMKYALGQESRDIWTSKARDPGLAAVQTTSFKKRGFKPHAKNSVRFSNSPSQAAPGTSNNGGGWRTVPPRNNNNNQGFRQLNPYECKHCGLDCKTPYGLNVHVPKCPCYLERRKNGKCKEFRPIRG